jgi:uncharacterized protein related to proFAR isomerase
MSGLLHIYICDNNIYEVPMLKNSAFKAVNELSNKNVLFVKMGFEDIEKALKRIEKD